MVNSSMKFKLIYKVFVIQEKFLVFINLLRGPDITRSGAGSGPGVRVGHPCFNFIMSRFCLFLLQSVWRCLSRLYYASPRLVLYHCVTILVCLFPFTMSHFVSTISISFSLCILVYLSFHYICVLFTKSHYI